MCLVSSMVYAWVLPIIYHSVCFTSGQNIIHFVGQHDVPDDHLRNRLLLVRNLYVGRTPDGRGDLLYDPNQWPIPSLQRLFVLCAELQSLTILFLDQRLWSRFQPILPARLNKVTLGPTHGPLNPNRLLTHPPVTYFTSVHTYLSGEEIENLVMYPTMERVRELCEATSMAPLWAVTQAAGVPKPQHIKEYQIVICGRPEYNDPAYVFAKRRMEELGLDKDLRVTLHQDLSENWVELVYCEFIDCRRCFINGF